jgi:hypothetical protein
MDDRSTDDGGTGDDGPADKDGPADEAPATGNDRAADPDGTGEGALHVATEGESWRFSLEDLDEDPAERITPGSVSLEHAVFVLLGVAATGFVIVQLLL